MLKDLSKSPLLVYRYSAALGAVSSPLMAWFFPEEMYDPMSFRWGLMIVFALIFGMSFASEKIKNIVPESISFAMLLVTGWVLFLMYKNNLSPAINLSYLVVVFASFLVLPRRALIWAGIGIHLLGLAIVSLLVDQPAETLLFLWLHSLFILFVASIATSSRINEQNRIDASMEELNLINSLAIGASRDAILLVNEKGELVSANETFFKLWGISPKVISENRLKEAENAAVKLVVDKKRFHEMVSKGIFPLSENNLEEFELVDGRVIEIYVLAAQMGQRNLGRLWFFRDITSRKSMEDALKVSEGRLRMRNNSLTEMAGKMAQHTGDLNAIFESVTESLCSILDVTRASVWYFNWEDEEMVNQKLFQAASKRYSSGEVVHFKGLTSYFDFLKYNRVLSVDESVSHPIAQNFLEGKYTGPAGALIHAQIRSGDEIIGVLSVEEYEPRKWSLEDQSFIASMADLIAIAIEAERRREIKEELVRSFAVLKATFDLSETGILVVDNDQNPIDYNELYLKTWDVTPGFLRDTPYEEKVKYLLEKIENAKDINQDVKILNKKPGMEKAGIIEFKDGRMVERYSKGLIVNGELIGRVWFYLDITERKNREIELINRNFELDSFVYRASHDLKAPLNSIMGLINIIREENAGNEVMTYISMMDKSVKKLDSFIRQLTQFSQDARLKLVTKSLKFEDMIHEIWEDLRYMENAGRVNLILNTNQTSDFHTDPIRLGIVLNNFISNAIKYQDLKKEESWLKIDIVITNDMASCRFEDNGLGIAEEHLAKVFDLFFRASVQASGSGLGLYITHNAIKNLDGKVSVESEEGKGTIFEIELPCKLRCITNEETDAS